MSPRNLWWCLGLEISVGSSSTFSLADVLAKLAEASLHMLVFCHQCNRPILQMWGRRTGAGLGLLPHDILWGYAVTLREELVRLVIVLPHKGKLILVIRKMYKSFFWSSLKMKHFFRNIFLLKHQNKTTVCKWQKYF